MGHAFLITHLVKLAQTAFIKNYAWTVNVFQIDVMLLVLEVIIARMDLVFKINQFVSDN